MIFAFRILLPFLFSHDNSDGGGRTVLHSWCQLQASWRRRWRRGTALVWSRAAKAVGERRRLHETTAATRRPLHLPTRPRPVPVRWVAARRLTGPRRRERGSGASPPVRLRRCQSHWSHWSAGSDWSPNKPRTLRTTLGLFLKLLHGSAKSKSHLGFYLNLILFQCD